MNQDALFTSILELTRTTDELRLLLEEISLLEASLFSVESEQETAKKLEVNVRFEMAQLLRQGLEQHSSNKSDWLHQVQTQLKQLEVVRLTLGVRPSEAFVSQLFGWVKLNIGQGIILDLQYQPSIIGGVIIEYQGKYGDYSLIKKVSEYFETAKPLSDNESTTTIEAVQPEMSPN